MGSDKQNEINKLKKYILEALDVLVRKYSEEITDKKINNTEFDINTFKVQLNNIEDKINNRIAEAKKTSTNKPIQTINGQELLAYKGPKYLMIVKDVQKEYDGILSAITSRRGKIGSAPEAKKLKIYTDKEIEKTEFFTLDKHLKATKQEIERLELKEKAETYNKTSGYKKDKDNYYKELVEALPKLQTQRDKLSAAHKEEVKEQERKEKEDKKQKEITSKETGKKEIEKEIEDKKSSQTEKETSIKDKEKEIVTKKDSIKAKEKELELEKKKTKEQEEKNEQEIKDMDTAEKAKIDADLESEKIKINAKYTDPTKEQEEKKAELEKAEKDKQAKLTELTTNIALKKVDQKKSLVDLTVTVEKNIKEKTKELEALNKELETQNNELATLKKDLEALKEELKTLSKKETTLTNEISKLNKELEALKK